MVAVLVTLSHTHFNFLPLSPLSLSLRAGTLAWTLKMYEQPHHRERIAFGHANKD